MGILKYQNRIQIFIKTLNTLYSTITTPVVNPHFYPKFFEKSRLPPLSKTAKGIYYITLFERQVVQTANMHL